MMTDDERAAREWFRNYIRAGWMYPRADTGGHLLVIERLLNRKFPRGADVPDEIVEKMADAFWRSTGNSGASVRAAIDFLHAHMTAPPPAKKVEAWAAVNASGDILAFSDGPDAAALICEGARIVRLVEAADE